MSLADWDLFFGRMLRQPSKCPVCLLDRAQRKGETAGRAPATCATESCRKAYRAAWLTVYKERKAQNQEKIKAVTERLTELDREVKKLQNDLFLLHRRNLKQMDLGLK